MEKIKKAIVDIANGKDVWLLNGVYFNAICDLCKSQTTFGRVLVSLLYDSSLVICSDCFNNRMVVFVEEPPLVISKL